jgi:hypothetical protein
MDELYVDAKGSRSLGSILAGFFHRFIAAFTVLLYGAFSTLLGVFMFMELHAMTYRIIAIFLILIFFSNTSAKLAIDMINGHERENQ